MSDPVVSVVMAVHNDAEGLPVALESILAQDLRALECIVVDDGSTDATPERLAQLAARDTRLKVIRNERNLGLAASLNRGIVLARAPLIARQDSGDFSHPLRLLNQIIELNDKPDLVLLGTGAQLADADGLVLASVIRQQDDAALRQALREDNAFTHGSVVFRKAAFEQAGGYDESFPAAQDYELFVRLAGVGQVANLPDTLYQWRFDVNSTTFARFPKQYAYRQVVRLRQQDPAATPNIAALMAQAPILAERLWWLAQLAAIGSRQASAAQALIAQEQPEWQDKPALLPYAVKYGLKLAEKYRAWPPVLAWLAALYPDDPAWQGRALRRIAARTSLPLHPAARALRWHTWWQDWRGWPSLFIPRPQG